MVDSSMVETYDGQRMVSLLSERTVGNNNADLIYGISSQAGN